MPDVHKAISTALQEHRGMDADKADEHIEALKESERYVLEVYVRGVGGGVADVAVIAAVCPVHAVAHARGLNAASPAACVAPHFSTSL